MEILYVKLELSAKRVMPVLQLWGLCRWHLSFPFWLRLKTGQKSNGSSMLNKASNGQKRIMIVAKFHLYLYSIKKINKHEFLLVPILNFSLPPVPSIFQPFFEGEAPDPRDSRPPDGRLAPWREPPGGWGERLARDHGWIGQPIVIMIYHDPIDAKYVKICINMWHVFKFTKAQSVT